LESNVPNEQAAGARARVDDLLSALRRNTQGLAPDADSALTFRLNNDPADTLELG